MSLRNRTGGGSGGGDASGGTGPSHTNMTLPRPGVGRSPGGNGKGSVNGSVNGSGNGSYPGHPHPPHPPVYQGATVRTSAAPPPSPLRRSPMPTPPPNHHQQQMQQQMHSPPPKPRLPSSSSPAVVASASPYGGGGGGGSPYHRQRPTYQYQGGGTTTTAAAASSAPPTPMPVPPSPAPYGGYSNNNSSAAGLYGGAMAMPSPSGPKGGTIGGAAFYGAPGGNDYAFANHSNGNNGHNSYSYEEDDDKYSKKNRKKSKNNASSSFSLSSPSCRSLLGVTAAVLCLLYSAAMTTMWMTARGQAYKLLKDVGKPSLYDVGRYVEDLKRRELEQRDVVASAWNNRGGGNTDLTKRQQQQQVTTLERQNKLLVKERDEWKARHEKSLNNAAQNDPHRVDSIEKDHHRLTKREAAFSDQIRWFMAATRRESKRGVLERFGPGPHRVEITYAVGEVDYYQEHYEGDPPPPPVVTAHDERPRHKFVVELAPLDLVPHAVHLFLEQADHGLLNGTYLYLNGPHIIQAGPQNDGDGEGEFGNWVWVDEHDPSDAATREGDPAARTRSRSRSRSADEKEGGGGGGGRGPLGQTTTHRRLTAVDDGGADGAAVPTGSEDEGDGTDDYYSGDYDEEEEDEDEAEWADEDDRTKKFSDLGLDRLAFPDYSADYPHLPWTLGYTGRPGGPDWYINKVDNTKGHGPGGQSQHPLSEQGDSCFGIVSAEGGGRKLLVQHVFSQEIYADETQWNYFMKEPVEIVGAIVLTKQPQVEKIHLGKALHPHHHHKHSQHHPHLGTAEHFAVVLRDALDPPGMNPVDSGPKSAAAPDGGSETGDGRPSQDSVRPTEQEKTDAAGKDNVYRPALHHRKPRLPKIGRAAEA